MLQHLVSFVRDEEGASAVEYGLIVGLIAVAIIVTVSLLGEDLNRLFSGASDALNNSTPPSGGGGG